MRKLFISQPMSNLSGDEIADVRYKLISKAENELNEKFEVIDSFINDFPEGADPLWFLGKSLELMGNADVVVFAYGWETARGCIIEHLSAILYGKEFYEEQWFKEGTQLVRMYE